MQGAEFEQVYDFGNLYAGFLKARRASDTNPALQNLKQIFLKPYAYFREC